VIDKALVGGHECKHKTTDEEVRTDDETLDEVTCKSQGHNWASTYCGSIDAYVSMSTVKDAHCKEDSVLINHFASKCCVSSRRLLVVEAALRTKQTSAYSFTHFNGGLFWPRRQLSSSSCAVVATATSSEATLKKRYAKLQLGPAPEGRVFCANSDTLDSTMKNGVLNIPNGANETQQIRLSVIARITKAASLDVCGKSCSERKADCAKTWCDTCPGTPPPAGFQSSSTIAKVCGAATCGETAGSSSSFAGGGGKDKALAAADAASGKQLFQVKVCDFSPSSLPSSKPCTLSPPVECFYDVVTLHPDSRVEVVPVKDAVEVRWHAVRDNSLQYRPARVFGDSTTASSNARRLRALAAITNDEGARRLSEYATAAITGDCNSSSTLSSSNAWSSCDASSHTQEKPLACFVDQGEVQLDIGVCVQSGLGPATQKRTCCTKAEYTKAELLRKSSTLVSTMFQGGPDCIDSATMLPRLRLDPSRHPPVLPTIPSPFSPPPPPPLLPPCVLAHHPPDIVRILPPIWWCGSLLVAQHRRNDWHRSMQAAFVGWSVPFGVIFAQYLVPWVAVMDVDASGLSNYLISECAWF
jgi:hypothetical protein